MSELEDLREYIDELDDDLLELLSQRFDLVKRVKVAKSKSGVGTLQQDRFDDILRRLINDSADKGLDPEMVKEIWEVIHKYSLKAQDL